MNATATIDIDRDEPLFGVGAGLALRRSQSNRRYLTYTVALDEPSLMVDDLRQALASLSETLAEVHALRLAGAAPERNTDALTADQWRSLRCDERDFFPRHSEEEDALKLSIGLLTIINSAPGWGHDLINTVAKLTKLETNWNGRGAAALRVDEALRAASIVSQLGGLSVQKPFVYPSLAGGIVIEFGLHSGKLTAILEENLGLLRYNNETAEVFDLAEEEQEERLVQRIRERATAQR